jgi:hypothetical protein
MRVPKTYVVVLVYLAGWPGYCTMFFVASRAPFSLVALYLLALDSLASDQGLLLLSASVRI